MTVDRHGLRPPQAMITISPIIKLIETMPPCDWTRAMPAASREPLAPDVLAGIEQAVAEAFEAQARRLP